MYSCMKWKKEKNYYLCFPIVHKIIAKFKAFEHNHLLFLKRYWVLLIELNDFPYLYIFAMFFFSGIKLMMKVKLNDGIIIQNEKFQSVLLRPHHGVNENVKVSENSEKRTRPKIYFNPNTKLRMVLPYCPLIKLLPLIVQQMELLVRRTFLWVLKVKS